MSGLRDRAGRRAPAGGRGADIGFTLAETAVALALFAVILAATGLATVRALSGTGRADRAVAATMLAGQALESARTLSAQLGSDGTTALLSGRTPALVAAIPVTDLDLSDTQPAYGNTAPGGPALPLQSTASIDGITYTVRTLVGTCQRAVAGGTCDLAPQAGPTATLYRVVAAVTWPGCARPECPVTAGTLLDPAPDPAFNALQDVPPTAVDKCWSTPAGTTLTFDPTYESYELRDSGDLGNAPVQIVVSPDQGTLTQNVGSATWRYAPAPGSYTTQFTYRLVDRYHRLSDPAVITLRVGGGTC